MSIASWEDQASIGVPPHDVANNPIGRFKTWYRYFPYSQQTAEKYVQSEWPTESTKTF